MKSSAKLLSAAALAALIGGLPATAQEDGVRSIIGQMDQVLRNEEGRGRAEIDTAIAALNRSLRSAALGDSDDYLFEGATEVELEQWEAPAANDDAGGESGASDSNSSDEDATDYDGDSGVDEDYPPQGDGEPNADDDTVFGINDGTGTDEPDMGICAQGGEPAWCLDYEPDGDELGGDTGDADMPFEVGSDFGDDVGEYSDGYYGGEWTGDDVWDIDGEVVVNSSDGLGTDEPDMGICDQGGEPAWCGEGG